MRDRERATAGGPMP